MSKKVKKLSVVDVEKQPLRTFTEQAYLNYSMYVILDRALPSIADGLKPVQRRIVYAMSELGLKSTAKYKKSARTVGDVLGKFHPHGDTACYEAMVLMAQTFSYRYPLVDGQGNWGAPDDPKSFAAMRYTESKLSAFADTLLSELGQGTVDWTPNFDGTLDEPKWLPARLPAVLLNGSTGIAVGMATDIPPHNLNEVVKATIHLLENPKATVKDLFKHISGPDYPTEAEIITPKSALLEMYQQGHGSIKMRAVSIQEGSDIVLTALPYQVSGAKVLEQIAAQMNAKKLPMIADLRDESDHENPTRLVIVPRSGRIDTDALMSHLYATTDLEKNYRVNLNMIGLDGRPQVKNLKAILGEWLTFRTETVKRRLQFRLDKVVARLHILQGLMIAYLNIDEVIHIIRTEDKPKPVLMKKFKLSDTQAEAILELKLRHLAKLEEMKIKGEQDDLNAERDTLEKTLASAQRLKTLIKKELTQLAKDYGDERRSKIVKRDEARAFTREQQIPTEAVTVILSAKGWVRAAKGHEVDGQSLNYRAGDSFLMGVPGRSNQSVVFVDSSGRTYTLIAHSLPSARSQGEPLTGRFSPPSGSIYTGLMMGKADSQYVLCSSAGYGFIIALNEMISKNKNGKQILKVPEQGTVLAPALISDTSVDHLAVLSMQGRLLVFPVNELPVMTKGKGNKLMQIDAIDLEKSQDGIIAISVVGPESQLAIQAGKRTLTLTHDDLTSYVGERGRRGHKLPRGYQKVTGMYTVEA